LPLLSRSGDGHRRAAASEENRSELWRRRWPPRRRACSPTGEHAAVERPSRGAFLVEPGAFLAEPGRIGSVSSPAPAKKKTVRFFFFFRAGGSLSPTNGVFFLFSFFPVPFLPHSDARELGLGFGNGVFTVFFWLVHPNGIRVRVSVCRLLFFSPSPFGFDFFLLSFLLTRSPEKGI